MVVYIDSVAFKLLELYRRANKTCQETWLGNKENCSFVRGLRLSVHYGALRHAMEVENISTSVLCPRAPKRTESLMFSQVRFTRAGETSVMESRL